MENGKSENRVNNRLWRAMKGFSHDVSVIPTMKSLDK